jgi:hypothetical protein
MSDSYWISLEELFIVIIYTLEKVVSVIHLHITFTKIKEIEEPEIKSTVPPVVEDLILLSFGHSMLEFEATLYQKFLHLTDGLGITCSEFKEHLRNMEERQIVISTEFLGKKCCVLASNNEIKNEGSW